MLKKKKKVKKPKIPKSNTNKGNVDRKGEGQLYDKIMRENLLELFLPLVAEQLNFEVKKVTPLVDKQPTTIIRETDSFLRIETYSKTEPEFILHLEFESKDDPDMIYRIVEYHGIELRKYKLPIKHVVVYLAEKPPKMRTKLRKEEIFEGFILVNVRTFSPEIWLEKEEPAKIIMAILGDYQKKNAKIILKAIFARLRMVCKTDEQLKKHIQQLIIMSRMRNLEQLTVKISNEMPISIDIEKDYLYKLGLKKAEELIAEVKAQAKEAVFLAKAQAAKVIKEKAEIEAKFKAKAAKEKKAIEAKAKAEAIKAAKEKKAIEAKAKAEAIKATKEKKAIEAKAKAEAIKAAKEKKVIEAKAKAEAIKAAKVAKEKAEMEVKARADKKLAIVKMKAAKFEESVIANFLNLEMEVLKTYLKEIDLEQKKDIGKKK